jgi:hypothetical protein
MISALLSDFDRLTPSQRATVTHWIIDDPDQLPKPSLQDDLVWDKENEEIGL